MEMAKDKEGRLFHRSPWIAGSFYLASLAVIDTLFLVVLRTVSVFVLPVVLIAFVLGISVAGALHLRNDAKLKEKGRAK